MAHKEEIQDFDVVEFFGDKEMRWYQTAAVNQTISAIELGG